MDVICDLDGTLMSVEHRRKFLTGKNKSWSKFNYNMCYDTPIKEVVEVVKALKSCGHRIIIASGREHKSLDITVAQLEDAGIEYDAIYLRGRNDYRKDTIIKKDMYEQMLEDGYEPILAIDDRDCVVKMWRDLGIRCMQVDYGDF